MNLGFCRSRRNTGDHSPFNSVIVLQGMHGGVEGGGGKRGNFELYYDDGSDSGLHLLPVSMSDFLMGSGFDSLLKQLAQIQINTVGYYEHPLASKVAIESTPTIKTVNNHAVTESHCVVCKQPFELAQVTARTTCH
ncbi:PREDICTED: probable E3 ubiquitin-protein ligase RHC2A [Nelumbo nucifera]|uniref:E3 ubiquitin-protein ligase RHC2A n=2 Tax=Nelumbo nucifera TaxID=4432 RepID=A0A822ZBZ7_NELNU|nr:PREDICTED: probable E3 ubiquitin-protein ligase RHC2A [Nelumbo nucifera]DAD42030.1 TPA_asm: hypothetical protein HUJ06_000260 [Nelumbo nucifera]